MSAVVTFLSECFGYVMNLFFQFFSALNYPYLWICIVAFALVARLISLPQNIVDTRKNLVAPVFNAELKQVKSRYIGIAQDDAEKKREKKKAIKAVYKKYGVKKYISFIFIFLQLPIYVALFSVVKNPYLYIPALAETDNPLVNSFFGLQIDQTPVSLGSFAFLVPTVLVILTLVKSFSSLKMAITTKQHLNIVIPIVLFQILLYATASMRLPIAISLYWFAGDILNSLVKKICVFFISKTKKVKKVQAFYNSLVEKRAAEQRDLEEKVAAAKARQNEADIKAPETVVTATN